MFNKEYSFEGKHAKFVRDLVKNDRSGLINRNVDLLILAPIIGFLYGKTSSSDNGEETTKIFTSQLVKEKSKLKFIYQLITILEGDKKNKSKEEVLRQALDNDEFNEYEQLFNSYVLGGVEILHDKLFDENFDQDDYLNNLYEFVKDFDKDLSSRTNEKDIEDIIEKYE